jgi:imidazolonepropionase
LGVEDTQGSLEEGKKGDIVLLDAPDWVCLVYHFGDNPIEAVFKEGNLIQ